MHIHLDKLCVQFAGMAGPLLQIPDGSIQPGARLMIRGPSGAGKTTLLHIMAGLLDDYTGHVRIDGQPLAHVTEDERCRWRRTAVGLVFQRLNLLGHFTALENVLLGDQDGLVTRDAALAALERLGLADRANQQAWDLSLGEQQRVAVARVTVRAPQLVLADEPTSSLDDATAAAVMGELLAQAPADGILIVSTHDARISSFFPAIWQLNHGGVHPGTAP